MRLTITEDRAGERLDVVLGEAAGSRAKAQRLIDDGAVTVDGAVVAKRHRVRAGEVVEWADERPAAPEPAGDVPYEIAYEDDALIVVDKPAGVVVHPAPGHPTGTLAQAVGGYLVHRLDRDTSGLLVVARTEAAHQALQRALRRRELVREYLALVDGRPPARSGTIDAPIGRDRRARTRHSIATDTPREAVTHFTVERALGRAGMDYTLLRVRLETGRTHQIRVHLESIGHPVAGDPEYGGRPGELGLTRQFLHATRLEFEHPVTGERVDVSSELPDDLRTALSRAGG